MTAFNLLSLPLTSPQFPLGCIRVAFEFFSISHYDFIFSLKKKFFLFSVEKKLIFLEKATKMLEECLMLLPH